MNNEILIICRGGGDLATGVICRLHRAGFRVLVLESPVPSAIRREAAFCEAVVNGEHTVEGIRAVRIPDVKEYGSADKLRCELKDIFEKGWVPVLADPEGEAISLLQPDVLVDAIIAKENLGTTMDMAPLVIGLGPGFTAGVDVHAVIETMRGHDLARIITEGSALPNTGIPGNIGGYTKERVIHAPAAGILRSIADIGDLVETGQEIARIYADESCTGEYSSVSASLTGVLRGIIRDRYRVSEGFKIADIDPRTEEQKNCFTVSDKARSLGGSVLELVCAYVMKQ